MGRFVTRRWVVIGVLALTLGLVHAVVIVRDRGWSRASSGMPITREEFEARRQQVLADLEKAKAALERVQQHPEVAKMLPPSTPSVSPESLGRRVTGTPLVTTFQGAEEAMLGEEKEWTMQRLLDGMPLDEAFVVTGEGKRDMAVLNWLVLVPKTLHTRTFKWKFLADYQAYVEIVRRFFTYYGYHQPMVALEQNTTSAPAFRDPVTGLEYENVSLWSNGRLGFAGWLVNGVDPAALKLWPLERIAQTDFVDDPRAAVLYKAVWLLAEYGSVDVLPFLHDRLASTIVAHPEHPSWPFFRSLVHQRFPSEGPDRLRRHGLSPAALACWLAPLPDGYQRPIGPVTHVLSVRSHVEGWESYPREGYAEVYATFQYPHPQLVAPPAREQP